MKKSLLFCLFVYLLVLGLTQPAKADLDNFLLDLNRKAVADIHRFNATLSSQFKVPVPEIEAILKTVKDPADAFMCLQLSQLSGVHVDKVVSSYRKNSGKGWGVIAKDLGIKPGSSAFHALKRGDFVYGSPQTVKKSRGKGKEKGKGKGKKK